MYFNTYKFKNMYIRYGHWQHLIKNQKVSYFNSKRNSKCLQSVINLYPRYLQWQWADMIY